VLTDCNCDPRLTEVGYSFISSVPKMLQLAHLFVGLMSCNNLKSYALLNNYNFLVSNISIERPTGKISRASIGPAELIKPHEQVTKVVLEKLVMNMMIPGSSHS